MFDLIKTFILGIWIEKKYRYLFIFLILASSYRFSKWVIVQTSYTLTPSYFLRIKDDGSLQFKFAKKYIQDVYPDGFQMPTKYGKNNKKFDVKNVVNVKECEAEFFKLYEKEVDRMVNGSEKKKFIIHIDKKIPKIIGDISYFNKLDEEIYLFQKLKQEGLIFPSNEDINYCEKLKEKKKNTTK